MSEIENPLWANIKIGDVIQIIVIYRNWIISIKEESINIVII